MTDCFSYFSGNKRPDSNNVQDRLSAVGRCQRFGCTMAGVAQWWVPEMEAYSYNTDQRQRSRPEPEGSQKPGGRPPLT